MIDDFERVRPKSVEEAIMRMTLALERIARNTDSMAQDVQYLTQVVDVLKVANGELHGIGQGVAR